MEVVRHCLNPDCRAVITLCNGHVIARDFVRAMRGEIPWTEVRELCGRCALAISVRNEWPRLEKLLAA